MAIEQRGNRSYFYRKRRVGSRVVSDYCGSGEYAAIAAELTTLERDERAERRADERAARTRDLAEERPVIEAFHLVENLYRAALGAAGFHQHARGVWRRRRGSHDDD